MGWKGDGYGLRDDAIAEPIQPNANGMDGKPKRRGLTAEEEGAHLNASGGATSLTDCEEGESAKRRRLDRGALDHALESSTMSLRSLDRAVERDDLSARPSCEWQIIVAFPVPMAEPMVRGQLAKVPSMHVLHAAPSGK